MGSYDRRKLPMVSYVNVGQYNAQTNGKVTLTAPFPNPWKRDDNSPSQNGDVISVQPDGSIQTRPHGTNGAWEQCDRDGIFAVFNPSGDGVTTFILAPTGF